MIKSSFEEQQSLNKEKLAKRISKINFYAVVEFDQFKIT